MTPFLWIYHFFKFPIFINRIFDESLMAKCCICKLVEGTLKIKEGNTKYKGKPICKECQGYRKLLLETK